jgi:hypothetical protein
LLNGITLLGACKKKKGANMPIPDDPLCREWVELHDDNPNLVDDFRPSLISIMATDANRRVGLAGSGFFMASGEGVGVVLTAKHVLQAGVLDIQRPHRPYARSVLPEFLPPQMPNIERGKIAAIWDNGEYGMALHFAFGCFNEVSDLACAVVIPEETVDGPHFLPRPIPLSTAGPQEGDVVQMVSFNSMKLDQQSCDAFTVARTVSIRLGTVPGVHPKGLRQYRWPCFTTTIPADPGMSGGLVGIRKPGGTVTACGVVCADNSSQESRSSYMVSGESVIGASFMALALKLPVALSNDSPQHTIQDAMRAGALPMAHNGIEQFKFLE